MSSREWLLLNIDSFVLSLFVWFIVRDGVSSLAYTSILSQTLFPRVYLWNFCHDVRCIICERKIPNVPFEKFLLERVQVSLANKLSDSMNGASKVSGTRSVYELPLFSLPGVVWRHPSTLWCDLLSNKWVEVRIIILLICPDFFIYRYIGTIWYVDGVLHFSSPTNSLATSGVQFKFFNWLELNSQIDKCINCIIQIKIHKYVLYVLLFSACNSLLVRLRLSSFTTETCVASI